MTQTNTERFDSLSTQVPFGTRNVRTNVYTIDYSASHTYVTGGQTIDVSGDFSAVTGVLCDVADTGNTLTDIVAKCVSLVVGAVTVILKRDGSGAAELAAGTVIPNSTKVTVHVTGTPVTGV